MHQLYLGSQSQSRQKLLDLANIPYKILKHTSDECGIDPKGTFDDYVLSIAQHKMEHLVMPNINDLSSNTIYVLTADTLMQTLNTKKTLWKPQNKTDAEKMLQMLCKEPIYLVTGCCLEKKEYDQETNTWSTKIKDHWTTPAQFEFCVDEENLDLYFEKMPIALKACGAGIVEDFGLNFLKSVNGSYTTIIGLPLYELRTKLKKMGFF